MQYRGAVARAATETSANGSTLGQRDRHSKSVTRRIEHGARRAHREIFIGGSEIWSVDLELHARVSPADLQFVGELEQPERRFDLMKS